MTSERVAKLRADMQVKEDLKTVALGTSKINQPRRSEDIMDDQSAPPRSRTS